jgi:hypothetical protein
MLTSKTPPDFTRIEDPFPDVHAEPDELIFRCRSVRVTISRHDQNISGYHETLHPETEPRHGVSGGKKQRARKFIFSTRNLRPSVVCGEIVIIVRHKKLRFYRRKLGQQVMIEQQHLCVYLCLAGVSGAVSLLQKVTAPHSLSRPQLDKQSSNPTAAV